MVPGVLLLFIKVDFCHSWCTTAAHRGGSELVVQVFHCHSLGWLCGTKDVSLQFRGVPPHQPRCPSATQLGDSLSFHVFHATYWCGFVWFQVSHYHSLLLLCVIQGVPMPFSVVVLLHPRFFTAAHLVNCLSVKRLCIVPELTWLLSFVALFNYRCPATSHWIGSVCSRCPMATNVA